MKRTAGLMCLGSLYAGALWIEYQTALLLGTGGFLLAAGSALALLATALYRAPMGHERRDGFHVWPRDRRQASRPESRVTFKTRRSSLPQLGRAHRLAAMIPLLIMFLVATVLVHVYRCFYES